MNRMDRYALLALHEYNHYANQLVLDTAAKMTKEQFTSPSSPSHGSVQALLFHMFGCEYFFLLLCQGKMMESPAGEPALPGVDAMALMWDDLAGMRKAYLEAAAEEALEEQIPSSIGGQVFRLARWQLIAQSLLHSGHHRGELSIVMTSLGYPLPTLDSIIHFVKEGGQEWPWG